MRLNRSYKYFIQQATNVSVSRLIIYFLILFFAIISTTSKGVYNTIYFGSLTILYLLYLAIFVVILPKYYLKFTITFNNRKELRYLLIVLVFGLSAVLADSVLNPLTNISILKSNYGWNNLSVKILTLCLIGFVEEYIFRVILLQQMIIHIKKIRLPIFLNSIVFLVAHLPRYLSSGDIDWAIFNLILIFLGSLLLADIYYISGSIVLVSFIHSFLDIKPYLFRAGQYNMIYDYLGLLLLISLPIIIRQIKQYKTSYHPLPS